MRVVWLKPEKGMVSIGRILIAEELKRYGIDVKIVEVSPRSLLRVLRILREDFDLIIGTTHLGLALGGLISVIKGKPFIADFVDEFDILERLHGKNPIVKTITFLERLSLRIASVRVVIPSSAYNGLPGVSIRATLCSDVDRFIYLKRRLKERAFEILKKAGVDVERPKVVYLGGFSEVYNLEVLIRAMRYLPEFELILIGGGPIEDDLKRLRDSLRLRNVHFLGYLGHEIVPSILSLCDVGVTLAEIPRQLKIYEYVASGLSLVVPLSVATSEEFEFADRCVAVKIDDEEVAKGIRAAFELGKTPRARVFKYSCRAVARVYARAIRCAIDEGGDSGKPKN